MKKSQLDRAIEQLESERAVLDLAIQKLRQQQTTEVARVRNKHKAIIEDMAHRKTGTT